MRINWELFDIATHFTEANLASQKQAFAPPPDIAAAMQQQGGGAAGAAPPPGGADPSMAAAAPPADPNAAAAMPAAPQPAPVAPAAPAQAGKPTKPDISTVAMDVYQLKSLMMHMGQTLFGALNIPWELPQHILSGPNRDPQTGMPMPMGAPGSTSDPSVIQQQSQQQQQAPQAQGQNALQPISPMPGAGAKSSQDQEDDTVSVGRPHGEALRPPSGRIAAILARNSDRAGAA
jgi:hypothetical protein